MVGTHVVPLEDLAAVVAELLDAFSRIREHLGKSEQDALDITAHLHERRTELAEAIVELRNAPAEVESAERYASTPTATPAATFESTYATETSYAEPEYTGTPHLATSYTDASTYGAGSLFETSATARPARVRGKTGEDERHSLSRNPTAGMGASRGSRSPAASASAAPASR